LDGILTIRSIPSTGIVGTTSYVAARLFGQIPGLCRTLAGESTNARHKIVSSIYHILFYPAAV